MCRGKAQNSRAATTTTTTTFFDAQTSDVLLSYRWTNRSPLPKGNDRHTIANSSVEEIRYVEDSHR